MKIQSALAVVLLLLAVGVTTRNAWQANKRQNAWRQMQEASLKGDELGIIKASESFFSASPKEDDPRIDEARALYQSAIVHWFSRLPGQPDGSALSHLRRFNSLIGDSLQ